MAYAINLASKIIRQLPGEIVDFLREAGTLAQTRGHNLYLVGGIIRDLILERSNLDIDLVVEGDAINLAKEIATLKQGEITLHKQFGTANLKWHTWSIDFATARTETYAKPGALPVVKPAAISADLFRRDFTINAMAAELNTGHFGRLQDPYYGRDDINHKLVRVLHDKSFTDDATRIWRAVRYEQRLGFTIEPATMQLLQRDLNRLDTVSGDRIRHEVELVLKETLPEKALCRASELGVMKNINPALVCDDWLARKFDQARKLTHDALPPSPLYLALLAYRLTAAEVEKVISYLRLPRLTSQTLRDTLALKENIEELSIPRLAPSRICSNLHGYNHTALAANLIATDSVTAAEHIDLYLNVLRYVKPAIKGKDLKKLGIPEGPKMKEILEKLREAKLDGQLESRREEEKMAQQIAAMP